MTDWTAFPGPEWYRPADAAEAEQVLIDADRPAMAVRAIAHLADAVSNDHAGELYPAALPVVELFLRVISEQPGTARMEALWRLTDWWGTFQPSPGFESFIDPRTGVRVNLIDALVRRVRDALTVLKAAADDSSDGPSRGPARKLLAGVGDGWFPF
jgi:hypothetical protein